MEADAIGERLKRLNFSEIEERKEGRLKGLERENCKREVCIRGFGFLVLFVFIITQLGGVHKVTLTEKIEDDDARIAIILLLFFHLI